VQVTASGAALPFCAALQRALQAPQMCQESTPRQASERMRLADKSSKEGFSAQRLALGRGLVGEASFPHRERFPFSEVAPAPPPPQHCSWPCESRYSCCVFFTGSPRDPRADARVASARSDRDLAQAYLVVPLQHAYTEHGRRPDRLKGRDRLMWKLLEPWFDLALCSLSFTVINPDTTVRAMNRRTGRRITLEMDDEENFPGIEELSRRGLTVLVELDKGAYLDTCDDITMRIDFASRWSPLSDARIVAWLHSHWAKRMPPAIKGLVSAYLAPAHPYELDVGGDFTEFLPLGVAGNDACLQDWEMEYGNSGYHGISYQYGIAGIVVMLRSDSAFFPNPRRAPDVRDLLGACLS
jgi:hypothetical protein